MPSQSVDNYMAGILIGFPATVSGSWISAGSQRPVAYAGFPTDRLINGFKFYDTFTRTCNVWWRMVQNNQIVKAAPSYSNFMPQNPQRCLWLTPPLSTSGRPMALLPLCLTPQQRTWVRKAFSDVTYTCIATETTFTSPKPFPLAKTSHWSMSLTTPSCAWCVGCVAVKDYL